MRTPISDVRFLFGLVAVATACRSEPAERVTVTDAAPGAPAAPGDAALAAVHRPARDAGVDAGVDALCAALLKEEKLDESALRSDDLSGSGPRVQCDSTGRAAWALRVDRLDAGTSVRQTILFAGADGARARLASTVENVEWPPALGRHVAVYDFDGDGVPEYFAILPANLRTLAPASRSFVTFKKGVISPYPTGHGFVVDRVSDIDGDGRPDLHVSFELGKRKVCAPGEEGENKVELAAHGLRDGTFSLTDPAAMAFAARRCPAMPPPDAIFSASTDPSASDPRDLSRTYVACARLRGKSADAVVAELTAACASSADATKKCAGPCRHLPDAIAIARFTPPLQLKDAPPADAGKAPH